MCCTSNTITVISKSNTLVNTELNDLTSLDSSCSIPKSYDTDINTSSNNNATNELIKKSKRSMKKYITTHPSHSNSKLSLNNCPSSSTDIHSMSLNVLPDEQNKINEVNCSLKSNNSIINTSSDSLYHNKITNIDIIPSSVTFINYNEAYYFNFSKLDYSTSSDKHNSFSHDNHHLYESSESIDVVTAVDLVTSTDNPIIYVHERNADHHELTSPYTIIVY